MRLDIVNIGDSKGVKLSSSFLRECGFGNCVEAELVGDTLVLRAIQGPTFDWSPALPSVQVHLIIKDTPNPYIADMWDDDEWDCDW